MVREDTLADLAALKQDAKSFRYHQTGLERQKRLILAPLYTDAKALLPCLNISQLNIAHYASLVSIALDVKNKRVPQCLLITQFNSTEIFHWGLK